MQHLQQLSSWIPATFYGKVRLGLLLFLVPYATCYGLRQGYRSAQEKGMYFPMTVIIGFIQSFLSSATAYIYADYWPVTLPICYWIYLTK
jgi:hypothetical protein